MVQLPAVAKHMSWLDLLPSSERAKVRKRMRSPAAYEKLREGVKGPEQLENEMQKNEALAECKFALETEPIVQEKLQQQIEHDIKEAGIEHVLDVTNASAAALQAIESGSFSVAVESTDTADYMVVCPEGNIAEKLPVQTAYTDKFIGGSA